GWAAGNRVVLGQIKTEEKSNEITAIPELLSLLAIDGCIVTIDGMGCQKEIAASIVERKADYVLALKGNQSRLYEDIKLFFDHGGTAGFRSIHVDHHETREKDHGRIEHRRCWVTDALGGLVDRDQWPGIRSVGMVESRCEVAGQVSIERRYYISS